MSRREKRKAKYRVGDLVLIHHGQLSPRDQNFGLTVNCSVCSKVHKALGFARINADQSTTHVPLCEPCLAAATDDVVRKFWGAPDLEFHEGGKATTEELLGVAQKLDATEH